MKLNIPFLVVLILVSACSESNPVCECFEVRQEIKDMLGEANGDLNKLSEVSSSEAYKELRKKKKECRETIEPEYFEANNIERNGRSDKQFLLEEFPDCDAIKELYKEI